MTYRCTRKRRELWSKQASAAKEKKRLEKAKPRDPYEVDSHMTIRIKRRGTGEDVLFECHAGTRIDNYSVYCNGSHIGIQSITTLMANIRKALPAFKSPCNE